MTRRMFLTGFKAWQSDFNQQFYKETGCPAAWHRLRFHPQYSLARMCNLYWMRHIDKLRGVPKCEYISSEIEKIFDKWKTEAIKVKIEGNKLNIILPVYLSGAIAPQKVPPTTQNTTSPKK